MLINYYATDGRIITSPQFHEGSLEEAISIAKEKAEESFPEWLFGFPIVAVVNVDGDRLIENIM